VISIERCRLGNQCTQRWEELEVLPGNFCVRYCSRCASAVHLIEVESRIEELARQGKCVALTSRSELLKS